LFHKATEQGITLKPISDSCDPQKQHLKLHFNPPDPSASTTPHEIGQNDQPSFVQSLQEISRHFLINNAPPSLEEIQHHIKLLKDNKASNDIASDLIKRCIHPIMVA